MDKKNRMKKIDISSNGWAFECIFNDNKETKLICDEKSALDSQLHLHFINTFSTKSAYFPVPKNKRFHLAAMQPHCF